MIDETPAWFRAGVCVQLMSGDRPGVIKDNQDKAASVTLEGSTTMAVFSNQVTYIQPKINDMVLVIDGENVDLEGELTAIDGSLAILKNANGDLKIADFVHLAKIADG